MSVRSRIILTLIFIGFVPIALFIGNFLIAVYRMRQHVFPASVEAIIRQTLLITVILLLAIAVMIIVAAVYFGRRYTRPIMILTDVVDQAEKGNLEARADITTRDEIGRLARAFNNMAARLQSLITELEARVAERTNELMIANRNIERRARQFEAIAQVARETASLGDPEALLNTVTELVSRYFDFYHVGIFLLDKENQFAVLRATNSEGGRRMLADGHRLKVGQTGIVGFVANSGTPRIALDTNVDEVFYKNPSLPDTRSEIALPLRAGARIIGVLDVQSKDANAFNDDDANTLTILANQISIAIENASLFESVKRSLSEAESHNRETSQKSWLVYTQEKSPIGFHLSPQGILPMETPMVAPELEQAVNSGRPQLVPTDQGDRASRLAVPIKVRDTTIGVIYVKSREGENWSRNQVDIVNAIAERLALSAENARLFEETTERANREKTVSDITTRIRETTDPETMLQTAINELKQVLGTDNIQIRPLSNPPTPQASPTPAPAPTEKRTGRKSK